jgi:cytochrome P450
MLKLWQEESLMISDLKVIQHVYANSDTFVRQKQNCQLVESITGPGILVAHGDVHRRQRRVLQPAFGISQIKALMPVFSRHSQNVR